MTLPDGYTAILGGLTTWTAHASRCRGWGTCRSSAGCSGPQRPVARRYLYVHPPHHRYRLRCWTSCPRRASATGAARRRRERPDGRHDNVDRPTGAPSGRPGRGLRDALGAALAVSARPRARPAPTPRPEQPKPDLDGSSAIPRRTSPDRAPAEDRHGPRLEQMLVTEGGTPPRIARLRRAVAGQRPGLDRWSTSATSPKRPSCFSGATCPLP